MTKLTVVWHKLCWPSSRSPTGFAAHGGLVRQVETLSHLFAATRILGPFSRSGDRPEETPLSGKNVSFVALTWLPSSPWLTWLLLPMWLARNGLTLTREISRADAVFPLIPSPIGMLGLVIALALHKPVLTRQVNDWWDRRSLWRLERALLERIAGGRNVVFATGGSADPPSRRNPAIRWLFSTTVSQDDLNANALPRGLERGRPLRLILVARQLEAKSVHLVLRALPLLDEEFPGISLDIVGDGANSPKFTRLAGRLALDGRVAFHGAVTHARVFELLRRADVFCLPAGDSEAFRQPLLEALACGLPVITTSRLALPLRIADECGKVLEGRTPAAVAAAVKACVGDPVQYRRMSVAALETARGYSLERWRDTIRAALEPAWGHFESGQRA